MTLSHSNTHEAQQWSHQQQKQQRREIQFDIVCTTSPVLNTTYHWTVHTLIPTIEHWLRSKNSLSGNWQTTKIETHETTAVTPSDNHSHQFDNNRDEDETQYTQQHRTAEITRNWQSERKSKKERKRKGQPFIWAREKKIEKKTYPKQTRNDPTNGLLRN